MSVWTYVGQIVNFLAFVVILYFILYKPVRRVMQKRKEEMEAELREAEKKLKEAERLQAEAEQQAKELDEKRESVLKEAREQAEAHRKELLEQAERQARERLERFRRIMEQERNELLDRITSDLRDTIVQVASSALRDASAGLSDRSLERIETLLEKMPEREVDGARKTLNDLENRVPVRSAAPLTDDQLNRLRTVLCDRLDVENVKLDVEEDPSLVAGLEVSLGHLQLEAHWRGMIEDALHKQQNKLKQAAAKKARKKMKAEAAEDTRE
jgi:F-type H+-transporting ATPase subunit b